MQTILVTGGAGYIGSHTVHYLLDQGWLPEQIVVFDNLCHGHKEHIPEGVSFVEGDLLRKETVATVFSSHDIGAVLHFAAYCYVGESMEQPGKYFHNNIQGGLNLLDTMVSHRCRRIVFSSTCATFGVPEVVPITESTPQRPVNPYGESKYMFERILGWYDRIHGVKSSVLRYFNAAGACFGIGERHDPETHLIPLIMQAALGQREGIRIFGTDYDTPDGTCIRDYIHVYDLADAHLRALEYLTSHGRSRDFNLGTGVGVSVREIVEMVKDVSGRDIHAVDAPRRPGDPARLIADNRRAKVELGWRPTKRIDDIIQSAWNWHRHGVVA